MSTVIVRCKADDSASDTSEYELVTCETADDETEQKPVIEVCFAIDVTGSMAEWLSAVRNTCNEICKDIREACNRSVKIGGVVFRDHTDSFTTESFPLNGDYESFRLFLQRYSATGGGDAPEAVASALHAVRTEMKWSPPNLQKKMATSDIISTGGDGLERSPDDATRVVILVTDAPPHGIGEVGDNYPNGDANGHDPLFEAHELAKMGVTIHTVGVGPIDRFRYANDFMLSLASITQGRAMHLSEASSIAALVCGSVVEDSQLDQLVETVSNTVKFMQMQGLSETDARNEAYRSLSATLETEGAAFVSVDAPNTKGNPNTFAGCHSLKEARAKLCLPKDVMMGGQGWLMGDEVDLLIEPVMPFHRSLEWNMKHGIGAEHDGELDTPMYRSLGCMLPMEEEVSTSFNLVCETPTCNTTTDYRPAIISNGKLSREQFERVLARRDMVCVL